MRQGFMQFRPESRDRFGGISVAMRARMHRKDLEELARNPSFIPFVYDYCDQCCQDCHVSARCLVHQIERRCPLDGPGEDSPPDGHEIALLVARTTPSAVADLDVELADPSAQPEEVVLGDPLEALGRRYAIQLAGFLRSVDAAASEQTDDACADALTVAAWFQMIIPVKIYRALVSAQRVGGGTPALHEDALGSAKLVLISICKSRAALLDVRGLDRRVDTLVELLDALMDAIDQRFPDAWSYVRPGLDAASPSDPSG